MVCITCLSPSRCWDMIPKQMLAPIHSSTGCLLTMATFNMVIWANHLQLYCTRRKSVIIDTPIKIFVHQISPLALKSTLYMITGTLLAKAVEVMCCNTKRSVKRWEEIVAVKPPQFPSVSGGRSPQAGVQANIY